MLKVCQWGLVRGVEGWGFTEGPQLEAPCTHILADLAHLQLPAFASALPGLNVLQVVPEEGFPGLPGVPAGSSLGGGLLESIRLVPTPCPSQQVSTKQTRQDTSEGHAQDWHSVVPLKHSLWGGPRGMGYTIVGEEDRCRAL